MKMNTSTTFLKKSMLFMLMLAFAGYVFGQMPASIMITPESEPNQGFNEITLTLTPSLACHNENESSLEGVPSVYMHSSAVLIGEHHPLPYDWNHVVEFNGTAANGQTPLLTKVNDDQYEITFNPAEFYGISEGNTIVGIYAVFNDGQWDSKAARDFDAASGDCVDYFIPLKYPDPTPSFNFTVNMTKMIDDGNFDPIADAVYAIVDGFDPVELLDLDLDGLYSGLLDEGIEEGITYTYNYRINDDMNEDVTREVTAIEGLLNLEAWWNDETGTQYSEVTFKVDMSFQVELGTFNPTADFLDVAGSFNEWSGGDDWHLADEGSYVYAITVPEMAAGTTYEFKFRINGDWETSEFAGGAPNRKYTPLVWNTTVGHLVYDNFKPGFVPVNLCCIMDYYASTGAFDPENNAAVERLDVAGTFNSWGGNDCLYKDEATGYYHTTVLAQIGVEQEYKFRYHSAWDGTNELDGPVPGRLYTVLDTVGGVVNDVECAWYNNDNPNEPTPPRAKNVYLEGWQIIGYTIEGMYTYEDINGDAEAGSTYQWYRSIDETGAEFEMIDGATEKTYTIGDDDYMKIIQFEVIPCNEIEECGDPATTATNVIYYDGIEDGNANEINIYPNPVSNQLTLENVNDIQKVSIFNLVGQEVFSIENQESPIMNVNTSDFHKGMYFIVFYHDNSIVRTDKFM